MLCQQNSEVSTLIGSIGAQVNTESAESDDQPEQSNMFKKNKLHVWNADWCFTYTHTAIFVWNEQCLIELPNQSNGWFKGLNDEHTLSVCFGYGARSQMSQAQTEAWLAEFVQVHTALQAVPPEIVILSANKQLYIENWAFKALADTQILIVNHYDSHKLTLRKNQASFHSKLGHKLSLDCGKNILGDSIAVPKRLLSTDLSKLNALQQYLSAANQNATKLKQRQLKRHCVITLVQLKEVLGETDKGISSYELCMSGLVQSMLIALGDHLCRCLRHRPLWPSAKSSPQTDQWPRGVR
ncbi:E3 ubiquitin- ligase HECTD1 [Brachionus plicatilis]|uniref:E3 ubiquitin-ligase HECTD1 n=1 Tax=Brachionus plicatilis TaxID=10195 RepID=A0A3M7PGD9_BRAPC|nr:E3 ubiquitin- ligase HECTD1 [Brachionus plicatilis]